MIRWPLFGKRRRAALQRKHERDLATIAAMGRVGVELVHCFAPSVNRLFYSNSPPLESLPEAQLVDRTMTCAACTKLLRVNAEGILPGHYAVGDNTPRLAGFSTLCAGSWSKGYPPRSLPEIGDALPPLVPCPGCEGCGQVEDELAVQ